MLTQLEAINEMLATVREAPVNTLTGSGITEETALAVSILDHTSRDVQRHGWAFNTDRDVTFNRDVNGRVTLPASVLKVDWDRTNNPVTSDLVTRGTQVYDRLNQTDVLAFNPKATRVVRKLAWDYLPDPARRCICLRAARVYAGRMLGQNAKMEASQDEMLAWRELRADENDSGNANFLRNAEFEGVMNRWR